MSQIAAMEVDDLIPTIDGSSGGARATVEGVEIEKSLVDDGHGTPASELDILPITKNEVGSEDDEDAPKIFIRDLSELVEVESDSEPGIGHDDDEIVVLLETPSNRKLLNIRVATGITDGFEGPRILENKADPPPPSPTVGVGELSDVAMPYTGSHELEMTCEYGDDPGIATEYQRKMEEYHAMGRVSSLLKKWTVRAKATGYPTASASVTNFIPTTTRTSSPSLVPRMQGQGISQSPQAIGQAAFQTSQFRGQRMIGNIRNGNLNSIVRPSPEPGTGSGVACSVSIGGAQQLPQISFDPGTGIYFYNYNNSNQVIQPSQPPQGNQYNLLRSSRPGQTLSFQNGCVFNPEQNNIGNQVIRGGAPSVNLRPIRQTVSRYPSQQIFPLQPVKPHVPLRVDNIRSTAPVPVQRPPSPDITVLKDIAPSPNPKPRPPAFNQHQRSQGQLLPVAPHQPQGRPITNMVSAARRDSSAVNYMTAGNQQPLPGTVDEPGSELSPKTFPSLVVCVRASISPKTDRRMQVKTRAELDASVKGVLLQTPIQFSEWLMCQGLIRLKQFCDEKKHRIPYKLGKYSHPTNLEPFSGGYVWVSDCCPHKQVSIYKGSVFEGSKYPPGTVLKLIYHWSCQTPLGNILQWVKVSSMYVKTFFTLLRSVCTSWMHENCPKLGGDGKYVEVGMITLGSSSETRQGFKEVSVEVLGVFDPEAKIVRLKVINGLQGLLKNFNPAKCEQGARAFQILWPLTHWIDKRSILIVDDLMENSLLGELGFRNIQRCGKNPSMNSNSRTNANIMNYLRQVVPRMFTNTLSVLSKSIVQQFLDELSWREIYAPTTLETYNNILAQITSMTTWDIGETLISRLDKVHRNPFADWSHTLQTRRSPLNTLPITLRTQAGFNECIALIMKDMMGFNCVQTTFQQQLPAPPTVTVGANTQSFASTSNAQSSLKRQLSEVTTASGHLAYYRAHYSESKPKELCLQSYYYGHTEPQPSNAWPITPFFSLKCPSCVRLFTSTGEIIRHLTMHVAGYSRNMENSMCTYCLKQIYGSSVQHLKQVHLMEEACYACRICQKKFGDEKELTIHMWDLHVEAECPYVCSVCHFSSSFHHQIVDHFNQEHGNNLSVVMCPLCLKVLPVKNSANLSLVVAHLHGHQMKRAKKCSRCVLTFTRDMDTRSHALVGHISRKTEGTKWLPYTIRPDEKIMMMSQPPRTISPLKNQYQGVSPQPTPIPAKKPKLNLSQKTTLNASISVPINPNEKYGGSKYNINMPCVEKGKATCAECSGDITTPNHFVGRLVCTKCRYSTACQAAMNLHHETNHQPGSKPTPGLPTKCVEVMAERATCKCGFSSVNPNRLAAHLITCEKSTAYLKSVKQVLTEEVQMDFSSTTFYGEGTPERNSPEPEFQLALSSPRLPSEDDDRASSADSFVSAVPPNMTPPGPSWPIFSP